MPSWIGDVVSVAPWLGAFFVAGFVVWKVGPVVRRFMRVLDRITGVPADARTGQKEIPGMFERLDHQDAVLETIRHEVEFNNGSSVKDCAKRTEEAVGALTKKVDAHIAAGSPASTTVNVVQPGGGS